MSDSVPPATPGTIATADDFLRMVRLSGLVESGRMGEVAAALAAWRVAEGPMPAACAQSLAERGLLTEWQIGKLREGKTKGFFLGKCKLLQPLGHGGMGSVYLAEHTTLRSRVAVKVLPRTRSENTTSSYLKRFEQEARAAAGLNHPNVARAFDLDTSEDANHFIVMEYIDGVDLEKRTKGEGPLQVRDAADMIRQAANGLQYAHDEGFVHRDIKPANLMVDRRGHLKILDLGLVQSDTPERQDDASITHSHDEKVVGTPDYMSPEQALGKRVDRRSDIYSLGCTLYYLLSGQAPFDRPTDPATSIKKRQARMRAHIKDPAPNILDVRQDVPPEIVELILRMMEKAPEARPQTAQEVADSLAVWLAANTQPGPRRPAPRRGKGDGAAIAAPPRRGSGASLQPVDSQHSSSVIRSGSVDGSQSGILLGSDQSGSGIHGSAGPASVGPRLESDIHAIGQSDASRPPSSGRSTGGTSAETLPDPSLPSSADGIVIDTTTRGTRPTGVSRPRQAAAIAAGAGIGTQAAPTAVRGWLFRRVAGLPLIAWSAMALGVAAVVLTAAAWWFAGGSGDTEEVLGDDDGPAASAAEQPATEKKRPAAAPKPAVQKPTSQKPAAPRTKPRSKPSAPGEGPSPLDNLDSPRPAAADAPAP